MLLKRDGFPIISTPTNDRHVAFLNNLPDVHGLTLNSNLYTNNEEVEESKAPVAEPAVFKPVIREMPNVPVVPARKSKLIRND